MVLENDLFNMRRYIIINNNINNIEIKNFKNSIYYLFNYKNIVIYFVNLLININDLNKYKLFLVYKIFMNL